jgi:Phosphoserine phosphatase RsbU, N-terminal domain
VSSRDRERFQRDYAPVFLRYLAERSEPALQEAYELGRRAMRERLSMLDLARIHHLVLLDVLRSHRSADELEDITGAASDFLVEALAAFEMASRGFMELRDAPPGDLEDPA